MPVGERPAFWIVMLNLSITYAVGKLSHAAGSGFVDGFMEGANRAAQAGISVEEATEAIRRSFSYEYLPPHLLEQPEE